MKTQLIFSLALGLSLRLVAAPAASDQFTAHEWGTFTSVQGADGVALEWNPLIKTDLPGFVHNRAVRQGDLPGVLLLNALGKGAMPSYTRMETPVIYFYSDRERTADVRVSFPQGRITEWYPQATRLGPYATTNLPELPLAGRSFIEWAGVKILPPDTKEISAGKLLREKGGSHYYEAREVDANFVRVNVPSAKNGAEYERDLFYRGVGFFQGPLTLKLQESGRELRLSTKNAEPLTDLFVLTVRQGQARYQKLDRVAANADRAVQIERKPFAPLSEVRPQIMREMAAALVAQGLYAKEAEAMVNTWKDQWFEEEGTRVLYLLSRAWTDRTLPLEITPAPKNVVRVMVGRAELITPEAERELSRQVTLYSQGDDTVKLQAVRQVRTLGLGRFLEPATRKMLGQAPIPAFAKAAWSLAQEASKADDGLALSGAGSGFGIPSFAVLPTAP